LFAILFSPMHGGFFVVSDCICDPSAATLAIVSVGLSPARTPVVPR
jgi:hypothetical protein